MSKAACTDDPTIDPGNPTAGFDTLKGTATGRCADGASAEARYTITDAGEPGTADSFTISISGGCSLSGAGTLERGNHQAHGSF